MVRTLCCPDGYAILIALVVCILPNTSKFSFSLEDWRIQKVEKEGFKDIVEGDVRREDVKDHTRDFGGNNIPLFISVKNNEGGGIVYDWQCRNHTDCCLDNVMNSQNFKYATSYTSDTSINECKRFCNRSSGDDGGNCEDKWSGFCTADSECQSGYICSKANPLDTAGSCREDVACRSIDCGKAGRCLAGRCQCFYPHTGPRCTGTLEKTAYVTLLFGGSGLSIAMMTRVWAQSLRRSGATGDIISMVTPDTSSSIQEMLRRDNIKIVNVEALPLPPSLRTKEATERWHSVFTKLKAWTLTEYSRVVYMDMDIIVERIESEGDGIESILKECKAEVCLARDPLHSPSNPMGNVGVIVLTPNKARYTHMLSSIASLRGNFRYPEQEWLTEYIMDPSNKIRGEVLPHSFNTCSLKDEELAESLQESLFWTNTKNYGKLSKKSDVIVHHFCGPNKPTNYKYYRASNETFDERYRAISLWHSEFETIDRCWPLLQFNTCQSSPQCKWVQVQNYVDGHGFCIHSNFTKLISETSPTKIAKISSLVENETDMVDVMDSENNLDEATVYEYLQALETNDDSTSFETSIIYQIVTDRFVNPSAPTERCSNLQEMCGGTFEGIHQSLDYLVDLGISSIWLSPITENVNSSHCYHSYCPKSLSSNQIRSGFGGSKEFFSLRGGLEERNIKIIGDVVINHVGSCLEDLTEGNISPNPFGNDPNGPHFHSPDKVGWCTPDMSPSEMVECWLYGAPDLNHSSVVVQNEIISMLQSSIQNFGFDALRIDAARHIDPKFLSKIRDNIEVPSFAEVFHGSFHMVAGYQHVLDGIFNFPLHFSLIDAYVHGKNLGNALHSAHMHGVESFRYPNFVINFVENHDLPRFLSREGSSISSYMNALATVIFWQGIPSIYYGGELGLAGADSRMTIHRPEISGEFEPYLPDRFREPLWESEEFIRAKVGHVPQLFQWLRCIMGVRQAFRIWKSPHKTLLKKKSFYAFSRGPVIIVTTNEEKNEIVEVEHNFAHTLTLCNVLPPFQCAIARCSPKRKYFMHKETNGMPAVYVPLSPKIQRIMMLLMYAIPKTFTKQRAPLKLETMSREDIVRPNPIGATNLGIYNPPAPGDNRNTIGEEANYRLSVQDSFIFTSSSRSILLAESSTSSSSQIEGICLFRPRDPERGCIETLRELRGRRGWKIAANESVKHVDSITIALHWLKTDNYYHFLAEVFPYILQEISLKSSNFSENTPGFVPSHMLGIPTANSHSFIDNILHSIGMDPSAIIHLHSNSPQIIHANSVTVLPGVPSHARECVSASPAALQAANDYFRSNHLIFPSLQYKKSKKSVVWIGRNKARFRRITNREEIRSSVHRELSKLGIELSWITPGEERDINGLRSTLRKIGEANVIVGVHGAGLSNILFAHPKAHLIEILPVVPGMINYHYWTLSSALGLRYHVIPVYPSESEVTQVIAFGQSVSTVKEFYVDPQVVSMEIFRAIHALS